MKNYCEADKVSNELYDFLMEMGGCPTSVLFDNFTIEYSKVNVMMGLIGLMQKELISLDTEYRANEANVDTWIITSPLIKKNKARSRSGG